MIILKTISVLRFEDEHCHMRLWPCMLIAYELINMLLSQQLFVAVAILTQRSQPLASDKQSNVVIADVVRSWLKEQVHTFLWFLWTDGVYVYRVKWDLTDGVRGT